ncbi:MAG: hypothetical protein IPP94_01565 [Ignavibacteria bacterium]|nr:hypothetical protein [Ignavibacteria bacterium]
MVSRDWTSLELPDGNSRDNATRVRAGMSCTVAPFIVASFVEPAKNVFLSMTAMGLVSIGTEQSLRCSGGLGYIPTSRGDGDGLSLTLQCLLLWRPIEAGSNAWFVGLTYMKPASDEIIFGGVSNSFAGARLVSDAFLKCISLTGGITYATGRSTEIDVFLRVPVMPAVEFEGVKRVYVMLGASMHWTMGRW